MHARTFIFLLMLSGCQSEPVVHTRLVAVAVPPQPVEQKDKILPKELKVPCEIESLGLLDTKELVDVFNRNKKAAEACETRRIKSIEKLKKDGYN